ncbi:MAG: exodeoxyribonuclease VII large subunit [Candidatus Kerfeldbacteria bacterium]|nr:exodeoxyribonuclease VII large subunit [Candidatus Kerfeldbacteria bacterium]
MQVYSVSEFVKGINELLSGIPVCVQGEVSNFHITQNRFVWFDLKDDKSYVSCFLLAFQLQQPLADGEEIQVFGYPALFSKSGRFHVRVNKIQLVGAGNLKQQFELLKAQLTKEGLFDDQRKRPLPRFPTQLGLVTSVDAAAYSDVLRILRNRWAGLEIKVFPVQVQGAHAVTSIVAALQYINRAYAKRLDTVILTRGGGSLEDLQAFNDETVVRAIFALKVPCIAAIGHERDVTLAEYVADVRASTPSNAAELAVPDKRDVTYQIKVLVQQQQRALDDLVIQQHDRITNALTMLNDQMAHYHSATQAVQQAFLLQANAWEQSVHTWQQDVAHQLQLLRSYHPHGVLQRGYSITTAADGSLITTAQQVASGDTITTVVRDGKIKSEVV